MRITKFVHACLLLEEGDKTVLIDPGQMSWESGLFHPEDYNAVDEIVITHDHADHMSIPFIQAVLKQFPQAQIITTETTKKLLIEAGIGNVKTDSTDLVKIEPLPHESMQPLAPVIAENIAVHVFGMVSHPGDSHHLLSSRSILAVPFDGPWAATIEGVRMADRLGAHVILPIHDWMWNDAWKADMYNRLEAYFAGKGVQFLKLEDGKTVEVAA